MFFFQAIIDANIIPPLVALLATAEFDIKKEAAWAISNATSGGTHEQIKYVVHDLEFVACFQLSMEATGEYLGLNCFCQHSFIPRMQLQICQ